MMDETGRHPPTATQRHPIGGADSPVRQRKVRHPGAVLSPEPRRLRALRSARRHTFVAAAVAVVIVLAVVAGLGRAAGLYGGKDASGPTPLTG